MKRTASFFSASALALLISVSGTAAAQTVSNPFSLTAGAGYARGGDTVIVGEYTDGSITNIKAGNGLDLYVGAAYRLGEKFAVQGDIGYQSSTGNAVNGELTFKRIPVELLGYFYLTNTWRLGAGARFDERVKLSGSGVAVSIQQDFDSAVGGIAEIEYLFTPEFGVKFRAVKETFKPTGYTNKFSGDQAAIFLTVYF